MADPTPTPQGSVIQYQPGQNVQLVVQDQVDYLTEVNPNLRFAADFTNQQIAKAGDTTTNVYSEIKEQAPVITQMVLTEVSNYGAGILFASFLVTLLAAALLKFAHWMTEVGNQRNNESRPDDSAIVYFFSGITLAIIVMLAWCFTVPFMIYDGSVAYFAPGMYIVQHATDAF